jgi:hypothetical protein
MVRRLGAQIRLLAAAAAAAVLAVLVAAAVVTAGRCVVVCDDLDLPSYMHVCVQHPSEVGFNSH